MTRRIVLSLALSSLLSLLAAVPCRTQEPSPSKQNNASEAQPADEADPIDFERARSLLRKRQGGEKLTPEEEAYVRRAQEARRQQGNNRQQGARPAGGRETTGLKPLTEMSADDRYKEQDGGLYGGGQNLPPAAHRAAAEAELAKIQPLDAGGKPSADGRVVLVSISMSNATQEFSVFKRMADRDPAKSSKLTIVDCAQGGQAMAEWAPPGAAPWGEALRRLESAGVTPQQVQVAWVKLANKGPRGELEEHGCKLQRDTVAVLQNAKAKFPNLRVAYLGSRIYAGYATNPLNPEPYAYESAYVVRWLIQDQITVKPELNFDAARGDVKSPLLLWGPYFWGDGITPRKADGLVWTRDDLGGDGTHPSPAGREKVAKMLLEFFKGDELARGWFAE
jgi:hypothetical protein